MNKKINLHTHTNFCDGNNSVDEMVLSAIEKGISVLGFSGHSMYPFASDWHIAPRDHEAYVTAVNAAKEKYKNQIEILLGFEVDYIPSFCVPTHKTFEQFHPDYLIGSVHYLVNENGQCTVDDKTEFVKEGIENIYNNNTKRYVCDYFEMQRQMLKKGDFEIWGHPDLVRKRNGQLHFFDENESWYKEQLLETVKVAAKYGVVAEINTGAIARGAMNDFYPSEYYLSLLFDAKVPVCINSDCHDASQLDCAFDRAIAQAKKIGYKELVYPAANKKLIISIC